MAQVLRSSKYLAQGLERAEPDWATVLTNARWRAALTCSAGPREPAGPLPAGTAGVARPGGRRPRAPAVSSPVDGPVGGRGRLRRARPSQGGSVGATRSPVPKPRFLQTSRGRCPALPTTRLPGWLGPKPHGKHMKPSSPVWTRSPRRDPRGPLPLGWPLGGPPARERLENLGKQSLVKPRARS